MKKVPDSPLIEKVTHSPQTSFSFDVHRCKQLDFPWHFHPEYQLGHAERKLADTDETIARICYACGYNNLANFNRQFKAAFSKSPRAYRTAYRHLTKQE